MLMIEKLGRWGVDRSWGCTHLNWSDEPEKRMEMLRDWVDELQRAGKEASLVGWWLLAGETGERVFVRVSENPGCEEVSEEVVAKALPELVSGVWFASLCSRDWQARG